ncbi:RHS repeat-associated core domain-containing protein [Fulvivirgaceae bacterium PWU4]|uniref:RHS repeat-associated core domain-containing protein n=1 Tax=Chryseosolibacter histidini TaxID=2782349 RepID=A0AAP2DPX2_9BACT|nr:DUF6443 domain-containing protein [Chryseosolibacter histidini]MBT1699193.1 RHS repeat-associated core domain-containing protein [Chryseosolibacter histidini]
MNSSKVIKVMAVLMLAMTQVVMAQHISGAGQVCAGRAYTYTATGITGDIIWSAQGGTFVDEPIGSRVTVIWNSSGKLTASGSVEVLAKDLNTAAPPPTKNFATMSVYKMSGGTTSIGPSSSLTGGQQEQSLQQAESSEGVAAMTVLSACGSYSGMVTLSYFSGPIVRWEKSYDQVSWQSISNTSSTYQFSATQTTYFRAVIGNVYCELYSTSAAIYITPPPVVSVTSASGCRGDQVILRASYSNAEGYRWYTSPSGGSPFAYTESVTTPALSGNITYWVSAVKGCEGPRVAVTATMHPDVTPAPQPTIVQECGYTMLNYWPIGGPYYWQSSPDGRSTSQETSYYRADYSDAYYVRRRDGTTGCWSPATTVQVSVRPAPPTPSVFDVEEYLYCKWVMLAVSRDLPTFGTEYYWQSSADGTDMVKARWIEVTAPGTYYLRARSSDGCWSTGSAAYVVTSIPQPVSCLGSQNMNYVVTNNIRKKGVRLESEVPMLAAGENAQTIAYTDGFGRTMQLLTPQASPAKKDVVQIHAYDRFGRESRRYLPYVAVSDDGKFKTNGPSEQLSFYSSTVATADRRAGTAVPWAETVFETSPLNRVTEQGAPGESWQVGSATVKNKVQTNEANQVRSWSYNLSTGQCASPGYYGAGELTVEEITDENGFKTWNFSDRQQRTVLVKKEVNAGEQTFTYYVYDLFSQLRMVIQPEGVKALPTSGAWTPDAAFISKWCFTYQYDRYGRVSTKKVPGAEPVHVVYNKRDQVILSQDGNQRLRNEWAFTRFDALNRPIMSGIYTHASAVTQQQMQQAADDHAVQYETRTAANYPAQHGYTTTGFPVLNAGNSVIHTVQYYDDYNFDNDPATTEPRFVTSGLAVDPVPDYRVTGKATGMKVAVPATGQMLLNVYFYDRKGNLIQQQQDNHLQGIDIITDLYDFAGQRLQSRHVHQGDGTSLAQNRFYEYDHAGRLTALKHQVNTGVPVTLASYVYNALGQQVEKKLHSVSGNNHLQKVDYRYNIRGWLRSINDRTLSEPSDLFGMELVYNEPPVISASTRQYNGNIAELIFNDRVLNRFSGYAFEYDRLGRMHTATHNGVNSAGNFISGAYSENGIRYDLNGNMLSLTRNVAGRAESFDYTYAGNSLMRHDLVTDNDAGEAEFTYDANGNMIANSNKDIESITYNHLNLTDAVVVTDKGEVHYSYDALGTRLSKTVVDSTGAITTRHYVKGIEYNENGQIEHFSTEEGRVVMKTSVPEYQYYLKDHLGNIRVTFTSAPETFSATATLEKLNAKQEQGKFLHLDEAVKVNYALFDHTQQGASHYAARLNGTQQERIGLAKSLSVMTGDVIRMQVFAKYLDPEQANWTTALNNFMATVAAGTAPAGTVVDGGAAGSIGDVVFPFDGLMDKSGSTGAGPRAYLNYIVFDRSFNYRNAGFVKLSTNAKENGSGVAHERLSKELAITEPGYVYIYLSNENDTPVEVYFDDFTVENINSMIVSSDEYYPFGQAFNSFSRENSVDQHYRFNGKERQTELGLNWDDFGARMYDPEMARWNVLDPQADKAPAWTPFRFAFNNPVRYGDPDGNFEMSTTIYNRYSISNTITNLPHIYKNKSSEFKAILQKHSGLNEKQTLAILEPGQGPRIESSGENSWSRGQSTYARFSGLPSADAKPSIVMSVSEVLSEKNVASKDVGANRLFYEAILFAQAVKYGILKKWSNGDAGYFKKTNDPLLNAVLGMHQTIILNTYEQEREKEAEAFLEEAYGIRTRDGNGKSLLNDREKTLEDIKKSQAEGAHPGTQPNPPDDEKIKKP